MFPGGLNGEVIGNTAELSELTDLAVINKGIYGLFDDSGPHYSVIYGDIMDATGFRVIEPAYTYRDLMKVFQSSTILRQCVDSYVTNIESYGIDLEYVGPEGQENSRAAQNEKARIKRVLATLTTDGRPLQRHREDSRVDLEVLGARAFEVIQDAAGRVVHFDHVQVSTLRMTSKEKIPTQVVKYDFETRAMKTINRRFRRFIQTDPDTGEKTWFKEFGDPRPVNPKTGNVDYSLAIEDEATAIYYDHLYSPGTPCGVPRWAGAIPALLGSREAEMVNLNFFRDNAIPAMAILVSGGALTEESFEKIESYILGVRGQASMNRIVVMEAVAEGSEAAAIDGSLPAPKIDIKPMLSERQHEGLFKDYIHEADRKARSSFRLPPIYIGSASEYNRASAFASVLTADQQIFVPERRRWDDMFYDVVISTHGVKYWRARSMGPGIQDPQEVARIVNSLGREGALTPNIAIKIANRYLDADIQPVMSEWGDFPFAVIMQYVKEGREIDGLDSFLKEVEQVAPPDPTDEVDDAPGNTLEPTQKVIRRLVDEVSDRLALQLEDTLQSIAGQE
jgi:PBSX family phage portal protein